MYLDPRKLTDEQRDSRRALFAGSGAQRRDLDNGLVVYVRTSAKSGKPVGMGFVGKAMKPSWHFSFRDEAQLEAHIAGWSANHQGHAERKAAAKAERRAPHKLSVGDVLHCQWGYDQTNNEFFEVTALIGARMVEIRKIGAAYVSTGWLQGHSTAAPGHYIGEPERKVVSSRKYGDSVRIYSFATASKIDPAKSFHDSSYA